MNRTFKSREVERAVGGIFLCLELRMCILIPRSGGEYNHEVQGKPEEFQTESDPISKLHIELSCNELGA